jgi:hypothetical protein
MPPFDPIRELVEPDDVGLKPRAASALNHWYCEICGRLAVRLADLAQLPPELITGPKPAICGLCGRGCLHG